MELDGFWIDIISPNSLWMSDDRLAMRPGEYGIRLGNDRDGDADVVVEINGYDAGTFRVQGGSSLSIYRSIYTDRRFRLDGDTQIVARFYRERDLVLFAQ